MFKRLIGASLAALLSAGSVQAQTCAAYTYPLANGTSANADQVMGNFEAIRNCANNNLAPVANARLTGNVGINIANPTTKLSVQAATAYATNESYAIHAVDNNNVAKRLAFGYDDSIDAGVIGSFYSGYSSKSTIINPAGGNVGIATTSPSLQFYVNGTAGGTSNYQVVSDARLKKNVQPLSSALALVQRLNPVTYDWRNPGEREVGKSLNLPVGEHQIGFIAQEVEKIVPEAVAKLGKGADATYGLKQETLIPLLVAAIKEQQAEIEALKVRLASLAPAAQH